MHERKFCYTYYRDKALIFLEDVATQQVFKPWEISDELPRLRYELSTIPETIRIMELLHKAAYRTGLGYSLYSPKRQLGKINTEAVRLLLNIIMFYDKLIFLFLFYFIATTLC